MIYEAFCPCMNGVYVDKRNETLGATFIKDNFSIFNTFHYRRNKNCKLDVFG